MSHPVGTGAFRLAEWTRRQKIVLVRNPGYRGQVLDTTYADLSLPEHRQVIAELQGKTLPQLDRIEIYPMDTDQPRFLSFMSGAHDLIQELPVSFIGEAVPAGNLAPALVAAGVRKQQVVDTSVWYAQFNMEDPVVGGYTPERVALRRAIAFAFDRDQAIAVLEKGQAAAGLRSDSAWSGRVRPHVRHGPAGLRSGARRRAAGHVWVGRRRR